jgi:hypothetical protein
VQLRITACAAPTIAEITPPTIKQAKKPVLLKLRLQ